MSERAVLSYIARTVNATFIASRLDHVAIVVTDVARSVAFYRDVLRLPEIPRPSTFDFPGAWFCIGPPEMNQSLHLLGMEQDEGRGRRHFCLAVDDLRAAEKHIVSHNCQVLWHAKHKIPGIDRFFVYDPDGNRVELQGPERTA